MVSPEIDWWIKNVTQVKKPVYNIKRYITNAGNNFITKVNQDNNIKLILITDLLLSSSNGGITCNLTDRSTNKKIIETRMLKDSPVYVSNFYYLVQSENINITLTGFTTCTLGYITISAET